MEDEGSWLYGTRRMALLTILLLVSIVSQIDRVLPFILAESIKADLNLSDTQLGLITGLAFSICYSLASLPLARVSDVGWAKQVLVWCILIWTVLTGLGGLATGFLALALSRMGVALGESGGTPASHALIAQKIPYQFRGRAIGLFSMGIPLGTMLGFALGGWASDNIGWRNTLFVAGGLGVIVVILVMLFVGKTTNSKRNKSSTEDFFASSRELLSNPSFFWMFISSNLLGFASAPFYTFTAPFLIRTYDLTASQVGLSFGVLQGLMGIVGTLYGGRLFDRSLKRGSKKLLDPPAMVFCVAAVTTLAGLFAPTSWMSIVLFVPGMFSFAFALPHAFGAGHIVAGKGKEALSSGMLMLGSVFLGSTLSPLLVGLISDAATNAQINNGLGMGLILVSLFSLLTGIACFIASKEISKNMNTSSRHE